LRKGRPMANAMAAAMYWKLQKTHSVVVSYDFQ
jgi:hypothetical protein